MQAKELKERGEEFTHKLFDNIGEEWQYKHANLTPWNPATELREYEYDGIIASISNVQTNGLRGRLKEG